MHKIIVFVICEVLFIASHFWGIVNQSKFGVGDQSTCHNIEYTIYLLELLEHKYFITNRNIDEAWSVLQNRLTTL